MIEFPPAIRRFGLPTLAVFAIASCGGGEERPQTTEAPVLPSHHVVIVDGIAFNCPPYGDQLNQGDRRDDARNFDGGFSFSYKNFGPYPSSDGHVLKNHVLVELTEVSYSLEGERIERTTPGFIDNFRRRIFAADAAHANQHFLAKVVPVPDYPEAAEVIICPENSDK